MKTWLLCTILLASGLAGGPWKADCREPNGFGIQTFIPPTKGRGNDWVLVLIDAAAEFRLPGRRERFESRSIHASIVDLVAG